MERGPHVLAWPKVERESHVLIVKCGPSVLAWPKVEHESVVDERDTFVDAQHSD